MTARTTYPPRTAPTSLAILVVAVAACTAAREAPAVQAPAGAPAGERLAVFHAPGDRYSVAYPAGWSFRQPYDAGSFNAGSPEADAGQFEGAAFASLRLESYPPPWSAEDWALSADSLERAESEASGDGPSRSKVASFGPSRLGPLPAFRLVVTGDGRGEKPGGRGRWHVTSYWADAPDGSGQFEFLCGAESHDTSLCDRLAATFAFGKRR